MHLHPIIVVYVCFLLSFLLSTAPKTYDLVNKCRVKNITGSNISMPYFPRNVLPKICIEIATDANRNVVKGFHLQSQGVRGDGKFGGDYLSFRCDKDHNCDSLRSVFIIPTDHSYFYCFREAHLNCHGVISDDDYRLYSAELAEKSHIAVHRASDIEDNYGFSEGQLCQDECISAVMSGHPFFKQHFEPLLEHELDLDFLFEFMIRDKGAAPKENALRGDHYQYDGGYVLKKSHSTCIIIQTPSFPDFSLTFSFFSN